MSLWSRRVLDARGHVRRVPHPDPTHGAAGAPAAIRQLNEMRAEFHGVPTGLYVRAGIGALGGIVVGYSLYRVALKELGPQDLVASAVVCTIAGVLAAYAFSRLGVKPGNVYKVAYMMTQCRLCLSCGYDLSATPPEADGCTVCSECGAAWNLGAATPTPGAEDATARSTSPADDAQ